MNLTPYEQLCKDFALDKITEAEFNRLKAAINDDLHGTYKMYNHGKCRCNRCKHANFIYQKSKSHNAPIKHGTTYAYNFHKCRCDECKKAHMNTRRMT